jgi:hypothetical protein
LLQIERFVLACLYGCLYHKVAFSGVMCQQDNSELSHKYLVHVRAMNLPKVFHSTTTKVKAVPPRPLSPTATLNPQVKQEVAFKNG